MHRCGMHDSFDHIFNCLASERDTGFPPENICATGDKKREEHDCVRESRYGSFLAVAGKYPLLPLGRATLASPNGLPCTLPLRGGFDERHGATKKEKSTMCSSLFLVTRTGIEPMFSA